MTDTPSIHLPGDASDRVRDAVEDLWLDAIATYRAMLDDGTPDDRIAVMKALPQLKALLAPERTVEVDQKSKAIEYLATIAEGWRAVTGSPREDIVDVDEDW